MRTGMIAIACSIAAVALLAYGLIAKGAEKLTIGEPFPDAAMQRLDSTGAGSLADYRGRWVLVNLWASWCTPCEEESPLIERYLRRHRDDGLVVVGINTRDSTDDAREFIDEYGLTWEQFRDPDGARSEDLGSIGVPESFLVDPRGRLALLYRGPVDGAYLDRYVTPLIEGKPDRSA